MHVAGVLYIAFRPYLPAVNSLYCLAEDGAFHYRLRFVGGVPNALCLVADNLGIGIGPACIQPDGTGTQVGIIDGVNTAFLPIGMHAVEQQVDVGKLMQSLEYVIPAEGEEITTKPAKSRLMKGKYSLI